MGHTYTNLIAHIVFSTKERRAFLHADVRPRLAKFVGGVIRRRRGRLLAMDGDEDHIHVLAILSPAMAISDQVRDIKALSSGWIHDTFSDLSGFAWQSGYSAFSIGKTNLDNVLRYIQRQEDHHRRESFEEELIDLLQRAGVEYDPKQVFD